MIGRRDRRKRLPLFVSVPYVSNVELFNACRHIARHSLHTGAVATLLETRITGDPPAVATAAAPAPQDVQEFTACPPDIDYLYSELTQISW